MPTQWTPNGDLVRVAILQPWLPQYRREFYERLHSLGMERGVQFDVYYGAAPPEWKARGDTISSPIATELPTRFFTVGRRSFIWKNTRSLFQGPRAYDLVIAEQAIRNLETYSILLFRRIPVAFWGHGRTYTIKVSRLQERIKEALTRRVVWFFGYTDAGVESVVSHGFPAGRTTVLRNTIDTSALMNAMAAVTSEARDDFVQKHDLTTKTALYIGGLDEMKRIPFLLEAARRAHELEPDFRLVVAGKGTDQDAVIHAADESSFITYVGSVFGEDKALVLSACQVIANPGRVGLSAVDSFAAGIPIVTTDWPLHAPEFEYLQNGRNSEITEDTIAAYVDGLLGVISDPAKLERLVQNCKADSLLYTLDGMVERFMYGVESALSTLGLEHERQNSPAADI